MVIDFKQIEIITAMALNEQKVAELYKLYSELYPDLEELWLNLFQEEEQHANWLKKLEEKINQGVLSFNRDRFKYEAIKSFYNYIKSKIEAAQNTKPSLEEALGIAINIEGGLIEQKFFEVFKSDSEEMKTVLDSLAEATSQHAQRVKEALENYKSSH